PGSAWSRGDRADRVETATAERVAAKAGHEDGERAEADERERACDRQRQVGGCSRPRLLDADSLEHAVSPGLGPNKVRRGLQHRRDLDELVLTSRAPRTTAHVLDDRQPRREREPTVDQRRELLVADVIAHRPRPSMMVS